MEKEPKDREKPVDCTRLSPQGGVEAILAHSGVNINVCLHCLSCAGGCPFIAAMDFRPNQIIRMLQFDQIDEVLQSATIWTCIACNTCSAQCPMAIDIPAVMDALRQHAIRAGAAVAEPDVLAFHREVQRSIEKYGRTHKLEIMLRFKLKTGDLLGDARTGLCMLASRKLELTPSRINDRTALKRIMQHNG